jgi:hypothetical protein
LSISAEHTPAQIFRSSETFEKREPTLGAFWKYGAGVMLEKIVSLQQAVPQASEATRDFDRVCNARSNERGGGNIHWKIACRNASCVKTSPARTIPRSSACDTTQATRAHHVGNVTFRPNVDRASCMSSG